MLLEDLPETCIKLAYSFLSQPCQPLGVLFCCSHCQANRKWAVIYARRPENSNGKGILMSEAGLPSRLKSFLASRPCLAHNFSANSISLGVLPHLSFIRRVVAGKSVCGWLCALACAANTAAGRLRMTTKNSSRSTKNF